MVVRDAEAARRRALLDDMVRDAEDMGLYDVDADVLIPILSCDFLLTGLDLAVYELAVSPRSSMRSSATTSRTSRTKTPLDSTSVQSARFALQNSVVRGAKPTDAVDAVNPKDRHVAMTAITSRANFAVTNDRRPPRQLSRALPKLTPKSVDKFAFHLYQQGSDALYAILENMAGKRTKPPMSIDELVTRMDRAFPMFDAKWREPR